MERGVISPAVRVPRERGEATRRRLREQGLLRQDLRPRDEGAELLLPVVEQARDALLGLAWTTAEFEPMERPPPPYQELARVPEEVKALLPSSFDRVGTIVVVKLEPELEPHRAEVGRALLEATKGARTVLLDRGVQGMERVRQVEVLAGEPTTRALHTEYGATFEVDLARAYFSPRLATEHHRVAELVQAGEVVLDLFAGVGPFPVLIAKAGKAARVYAVDANPDAVALLEANARRNGVEGKVRAVLADASSFAATLEGQCDRVIMNLPHGADAFWEAALGACKPRAWVHYHRILDKGQEDAHAARLVERALAGGWAARVAGQREVRLYSPSKRHVAFDVEVRRLPTA